MGPEQNYGYQPQQPQVPLPDYSVQGAPTPPSRAKQVLIIVAIVIGALTVILLLLVLLFSSPSSKDDMGEIQANYIEISRVSELASESDRAKRSTKHLAATLGSTSLSSQVSINAFADDEYGSGFSETILSSAQNDGTDEALEEAGKQNTYDEEFSAVVKALLEDTNQKIIATFNDNPQDQDLTNLLNRLGNSNLIIIESLN